MDPTFHDRDRRASNPITYIRTTYVHGHAQMLQTYTKKVLRDLPPCQLNPPMPGKTVTTARSVSRLAKEGI